MRNEIANFRDCKSIAIMGGTFDPIHYGHLVTAEAVRHRFQVDKVVFIPTGRPAHKTDKEVTHNEHRYLMAVLATMRNENFEVSRLEIDRPGITYTIDTIEQLKKMCRPDVRLYFITGADAIHQIMTWKEPERLLSLCDFVAVTRPGYQKNQMFEEIGELREKFASRIHYMEVPALAISSSDIRTRAQKGMPIQYLLPQEVEDYIHKFGLYRNQRKNEVKFMLPIEVMQEKLQSTLSVKRYIHTMGVSEEAVRLAEIFGTQAEQQKAKVAGLLHDCAKDYPKELREQGFAVVAVNYRLSPKAKNPAYIEDAAEAVAWVFKNIEKYGGRKDHIFVSGHSAGGYLSLILAMDKKYMAAYGADADSVAAYLPVSGQTVTHFTIRKERGLPDGIPVVDEYAPVNKARKETAPLVLITGDKHLEMAARYEENALLEAVLKSIGNKKVTLYEMQGFDHGQVLGPACYLIADYVKRFK